MDYKNIALTEAMQILFPKRKNLVKNVLSCNGVEDMYIFGPFSKSSYKRSSIINSNFINESFRNTAFTGSSFSFVNFIDVDFYNTNMQSCVFNTVSMHNEEKDFSKINGNRSNYRNISFNNSTFKKCSFKNISFYGCNFCDVKFVECEFYNCRFSSAGLDGTCFIGCKLDGVITRNLNMDYSQFYNCILLNCQLSAFQSPYTIGLLQLVDINDNNIFAFHGDDLSAKIYYSKILECLLPYLNSINEYFPLANIYGFFNDKENFKKNLYMGIQTAITKHNFRVVAHYCDLIGYYNYLSSAEKKVVLKYINNELESSRESDDIDELIKYSEVISYKLSHETESSAMTYMTIDTSSFSHSDDRIELLRYIDDEISLLKLDNIITEHNITFSHNSPLWLDIVLQFTETIGDAALQATIAVLIEKIYNKIEKKKKMTAETLENQKINRDKKTNIKITSGSMIISHGEITVKIKNNNSNKKTGNINEISKKDIKKKNK